MTDNNMHTPSLETLFTKAIGSDYDFKMTDEDMEKVGARLRFCSGFSNDDLAKMESLKNVMGILAKQTTAHILSGLKVSELLTPPKDGT